MRATVPPPPRTNSRKYDEDSDSDARKSSPKSFSDSDSDDNKHRKHGSVQVRERKHGRKESLKGETVEKHGHVLEYAMELADDATYSHPVSGKERKNHRK
jgi:hypothetical protein